jgi:hypothetical protein
MAKLHKDDEEAIDTIDAVFFSGDVLYNEENLDYIEEFLTRWKKRADEIRIGIEEIKNEKI